MRQILAPDINCKKMFEFHFVILSINIFVNNARSYSSSKLNIKM